jgi:hypothetical protein
MPQAILKGKSIPKVVRVNADDDKSVLYKNLGNGQRVPFMWTTTVTLASGTTEVVVASGVSFSDFAVAEGQIQVSPVFTVASGLTYDTALLGKVYIEKDVANNVVKLKSTASTTQATDWDIFVSLGTGVSFSSTDTNQIWKRRDSNSY